jgi:Zn-dependent peptidase ImmA (M78 family)
MAGLYRRPLLTFYLPAPPVRAERGEDFRTLPEDQRIDSAAMIDALVRDVRARQSQVRGLLDEEEAPQLVAVAASRIEDGVQTVARRLAHWLQFDLSTFRRERTVENAFAYLRAAAERAGVFVLLIGNLGSHHSAIDPEAFRGFALADPIAPFVVINDQDAKVAWPFTLLHELAHVAIGASGISGGTMEVAIEVFCNEIAGELLLPRAELASFAVAADDARARADITTFAQDRNVSRAMVAYRLRLVGILSEGRWRAICQIFREEYLRDREERRARERANDSGPSYYVVRRHRVGGALLELVRRSLDEGALTPTRAGKILGVKARNVEPLVAGATV